MADKSTSRVEFNEEAKLEAPRIVLEHINDKEHWLSVNLAAYREQGRAEVLALVRKLPDPVRYEYGGFGVQQIEPFGPHVTECWKRCAWCGIAWDRYLSGHGVEGAQNSAEHKDLPHPANGCLFVLAQETGKEQA